MKGTLYVITNKVNGKQYIGKTYKTVEERFLIHVQDSKRKQHQGRKLYRAMNEFGADNFHIQAIGQYEEKELEYKEMEYIYYYDTYRNGYNETLGGDGKRYIDTPDEEFVRLYHELGTITKVAELTGHDAGWISTIIKNSGAKVSRNGRKPIRINELGVEFDDLQDCSNWLIANGLAGTTVKNYVSSSIRRVLKGERKKYCGLTFTLI